MEITPELGLILLILFILLVSILTYKKITTKRHFVCCHKPIEEHWMTDFTIGKLYELIEEGEDYYLFIDDFKNETYVKKYYFFEVKATG